MFVPLWIIIANAMLVAFLITRAMRSGGGDMLERQRRTAPTHSAADEHRLMTLPQVQQAMANGHKIEAIRHVREASGMGLKDAKQMVERHFPR
ncbi:hypothetical protein GCM10009127_16430 [Alteraurantiacibacter aestuarii]|uniref:Large ribosomal subunit protein bL12 C-terminal domain-containing protein n=1 Tax=Alteraurantiacibacter aestuarii TaxID=650004 RepID=A0A844ZH09_9SPHN|nr:ribosomal protein L7/L12 [Alteraurantiacibacter aestuarii]MXO87771.1 hypothetical protein [Alteraurantiacibacter aestuarii]